jgi:hypothetical protein
MLAGLISDFSLLCKEPGIDIALATVDIALVIVVVAGGASWGLLIAAPGAATRDERTLCPGFSLIIVPTLFCCSSLLLRWSSKAAAPVSGAGENRGEKAPENLGDLGDGDAVKPATDVRLEGIGNWSGRVLFRDLDIDASMLECVVPGVAGMDVKSGMSPLTEEVVAETGTWSDAIRLEMIKLCDQRYNIMNGAGIL